MPHSRKYSDGDDDNRSGPMSLPASAGQSTKGKGQAKAPAKNDDKGGWLNGLFGRFSMRPKNQMKLPDDKNPTIVWDPAKKRWVNTEEDGTESTSELRPPPKLADLMPKPMMQQQHASMPDMSRIQQHGGGGGGGQLAQAAMMQNGGAGHVMPMAQVDGNAVTGKPPMPGGGGGGNMFKMQRSRNLKKSYVDVFNPGGGPSGGSAPSLMEPSAGNAPTGAPVPNFFIPAPVGDPNAPMDFLTPTTGMPSIDHPAQYDN